MLQLRSYNDGIKMYSCCSRLFHQLLVTVYVINTQKNDSRIQIIALNKFIIK
jgi:hypothetical protein